MWEVVRIGGELQYGGVFESFKLFLDSQATFPAVAGVPIIESGRTGDVLGFWKWALTLPFPKIVFGDLLGSLPIINTEISEILTGTRRGQNGYFVLLSGLIGESVYLYGLNLYWIHAVTLAGFTSAALAVLGESKALAIVHGYFALAVSYLLTRGGVGSYLPLILNQFLLLYALIAAFRYQKRQKSV
jgi:hypothetical protein